MLIDDTKPPEGETTPTPDADAAPKAEIVARVESVLYSDGTVVHDYSHGSLQEAQELARDLLHNVR